MPPTRGSFYLGCVFVLLFGGACDSGKESGGEDRAGAVLTLTGDAVAGAEVFSDYCASCHAADGSGEFGPSLQGTGKSDEEIVDFVLNGESAMPPLGDDLTDQEIADVLAHVRTL